MALPTIPVLQHKESDHDYAIWSAEEEQLRAYLLATQRGMTTWFKERQVSAETWMAQLNPEEVYGDEGFVAYMEDTGIFWPDYWELNASMVIRDAFRIYEVFLFNSAHRVLRRYRAGLVNYGSEQTWNFNECVKFYHEYLGLTVLPDELKAAKWIRDKLTHLSEISSPGGKALLAENRELLGLNAEISAVENELGLFHQNVEIPFGQVLRFSPLETWRILGMIRNQANLIGKALHGFIWNRNHSTLALDNLKEHILVNPRINSRRPGDEAIIRFMPTNSTH